MEIKTIKDLEIIFSENFNKSEKAKKMGISRQNFRELELKIKEDKNFTSFKNVLALVKAFNYKIILEKI